MTLLLALLGLVGVGTALAGAVAARALRRLGHRCVERPVRSCERCSAVSRGADRGGHLVCACGAVSPHLFGADLLAWGAEHHGERLPPFPADAEPVGAAEAEPAGQATDAATADAATATATADADVAPVRRTTRVRAAAEEEERIRQILAEELEETRRRMIDKARRKPDPVTPQLLREAEQLGARPDVQPPVAEGSDVSPPRP
jgi:hypothetical protein